MLNLFLVVGIWTTWNRVRVFIFKSVKLFIGKMGRRRAKSKFCKSTNKSKNFRRRGSHSMVATQLVATKQKQLSDIPEEVFDSIFNYLTLDDILRFRKVARFTKIVSEKYIRVHIKATDKREVELCFQTDCGVPANLKQYLSSLQDENAFNIPSSRYYISYKSDKVFDRKSVQQFVELCGSSITHLRFKNLQVPVINRAMIRFFEGLPKLSHLEVDNLSERRIILKPSCQFSLCHLHRKKLKLDSHIPEHESAVAPWARPVFAPGSLKSLKSLCISSYSTPNNQLLYVLDSEIDEIIDPDDFNYLWKFVQECSGKLESLSCPRSWAPGSIAEDLDHHQQVLRSIKAIVEKRAEDVTDQNLKFVDIEELREPPWGDSNDLLCEVLMTCFLNGVKLQNVQSRYIEQMSGLGQMDMSDYEDQISCTMASLIGVKESILIMELSALEKIVINTGDREAFQIPCWNFRRPEWPNLKEMDLRVAETPNRSYSVAVNTKLLEFLFVDIIRRKMENLKISFLRKTPACETTDHNLLRLQDPGYVLSRNLGNACPNLKKLSISGWIGGEMDFEELWNGLPLLEAVRLNNCRNLTDSCFMTMNRKRSPPSLKHLKKLKLESLEKMPGITDFLLRNTLCHKPLKELRLHSSKPLDQITMKGIESLLSGTFADTIEKFQLVNNLLLKGIGRKRLMRLESRFRSSQFTV